MMAASLAVSRLGGRRLGAPRRSRARWRSMPLRVPGRLQWETRRIAGAPLGAVAPMRFARSRRRQGAATRPTTRDIAYAAGSTQLVAAWIESRALSSEAADEHLPAPHRAVRSESCAASSHCPKAFALAAGRRRPTPKIAAGKYPRSAARHSLRREGFCSTPPGHRERPGAPSRFRDSALPLADSVCCPPAEPGGRRADRETEPRALPRAQRQSGSAARR